MKFPLHIRIIFGLILGIAWSFLSTYLGWNQFTISWISPFGDIFIRLLKFIAVPLVLFSIIAGVSGLKDVSKLGKLGGKTLLTYLLTTMTAVGVGLLIGNLGAPGKFVDDGQRLKNRLQYELWANENNVVIKDGQSYLTDPAHADLVQELKEKVDFNVNTDKIADKLETAEQSKDEGPLKFLVDMVPENIILSISNNKLMLQVIFFAIFFGITLVMIPPDKSKPVIDFVNGANEVFLRMVDVVMKVAPFFVFALLAGVIAKMANTVQEVLDIFIGLGTYSIGVVAGLFFMIFIFYPLLVTLIVKRISYKQFFKNISPAQFLAFSTSSSAATLPVTMECVEENMGVSKSISSFVLPIGATVNMDGTSLYQAVAVIFLAQLHMIDLDLGQQLTIILTATLASIGSAAVPSAGLVMLIIVLQSVGLNPAWIAIIFPVDRILDMCRTVVNVTGDASVSTLIAASEGELQTNEKE